MKLAGVLGCVIVLCSCGSRNTPGPGTVSSLGPAQVPATYTPRLGVAVTTASRTCIAIQNANLTANGPVTLISPMAPQTFTQAEIAAIAPAPCPISKDVDPTISNYDVHVLGGAKLPKLTPLIAVVGTSAPFSMDATNSVLADLDQNGKTQSFRACSAADGTHVTVWSGNPLDGTLLWHGYYYEPGNPGVGPACTPKEMPVV